MLERQRQLRARVAAGAERSAGTILRCSVDAALEARPAQRLPHCAERERGFVAAPAEMRENYMREPSMRRLRGQLGPGFVAQMPQVARNALLHDRRIGSAPQTLHVMIRLHNEQVQITKLLAQRSGRAPEIIRDAGACAARTRR